MDITTGAIAAIGIDTRIAIAIATGAGTNGGIAAAGRIAGPVIIYTSTSRPRPAITTTPRRQATVTRTTRIRTTATPTNNGPGTRCPFPHSAVPPPAHPAAERLSLSGISAPWGLPFTCMKRPNGTSACGPETGRARLGTESAVYRCSNPFAGARHRSQFSHLFVARSGAAPQLTG